MQLVAAAAASSPRSGSLRRPPAMATAIRASATSTRTGARQRRVRAVLPAFPIWSPAPRLVGWSRIALSVAGRQGNTIFGPFDLHSAAMTDVGEHTVTAFNTDTASSNRIHDDATARRFGFRGGLVPGVGVYAYLVHLPAAGGGRDWVARGSVAARFEQPVYDGDAVHVAWGPDGALELRDPSGHRCAVAPPAEAAAPATVVDLPLVPTIAREDRPPASPETLAVGTLFALEPHRFDAGVALRYLDDVREDLALFREEGIAHPAWILRDANYVLSANVELGPWIHVESDVVHHGLVTDGALVSARARVERLFERKGHRFVTLAVQHLADDRTVMTTTHTAIYRPRQVVEGG